MAIFFCLEGEDEISESKAHVHEEGMDESADDLLVLAKDNANWLVLHLLLPPQLLHQVFIDSQHFRLGQQQDNLNEDIVHQSERHLLVILILHWRHLHPDKRIHPLIVRKTVRLVRAPSEL